MNRFDILPSRHDIGIMYGSGKYYMIVYRPAKGKQPAKRTSYRFELAETYDTMKAENEAKKAAIPVYTPSIAHPQPNQGESLKEALTLMQGLVMQVFGMFQPLINAALVRPEPPALPPPVSNPMGDMGFMKTFNEVMKNQVKENVRFYNDITRSAVAMGQTGPDTDIDTPAPVEKEPEDFLSRIMKIIEPFISILAENSIKAKAAAAGFRAIPEVKKVIQEISKSPDNVNKIVSYVVEKEGPEGAVNALKNMGIDPDKYKISMVQVPVPPQPQTKPAKKPVKKEQGKK